MFRIETIRYFLGIVPGSESERIETVFAATWLTILVSFSCFGAFVRFAAITGALGVQGAIVDVGIRLIAMITVIALSVILYQYIAALFFFLVEWLIYFPIQYSIKI